MLVGMHRIGRDNPSATGRGVIAGLIKDQIRLSAIHVMPAQADVASHTK